MEWLIRSGHVADLVLACLVLEAALLLAWRRRTGRGPGIGAILALLLPGGFLVLALRAALTDAWWPAIPALLAGALVAHLVDVAGRLRGGRPDDVTAKSVTTN